MSSICLYFRVMVKDPFHANCLPVHIGTLVELGKANGKIYTITNIQFVNSVFVNVLVAFALRELTSSVCVSPFPPF